MEEINFNQSSQLGTEKNYWLALNWIRCVLGVEPPDQAGPERRRDRLLLGQAHQRLSEKEEKVSSQGWCRTAGAVVAVADSAVACEVVAGVVVAVVVDSVAVVVAVAAVVDYVAVVIVVSAVFINLSSQPLLALIKR